jgi:glycosyltransferase involved in cell wall biosynthesis
MTIARPAVSVVIPALNCADTIDATLHALQSQVGWRGGNVEILVVDNGSHDCTAERAAACGATVLHEPTPGVSAARNCGLRAARGDIYINIDGDTVPARTWLRELVKPFDDPQVLLVGGRIVSFRPETPVEQYIEQSGLHNPQNNIQNPVMPFVVGCNLAVRRQTALDIGGWDETFLRADDIEFSTRLLSRLPTRLVYQPTAVLFHRNRKTIAGLRRQAYGYGHGLALVYRRYPERVNWHAGKLLRIAGIVSGRLLREATARFRHAAGLSSGAERDFAHFHRVWGWQFWRGFVATYYGGGKPK